MNIEQKNAISTLAKSYMTAHNVAADTVSAETLAAENKAKTELDKAVEAYNDSLRTEYYKALAAAEAPFLAAIEQKSFKGICSYKVKFVTLPDKTKGKKFDDISVDFDNEEFFNLKKLDSLNEKGSWGHEASWSSTLFSLRLPLACARAQATALDMKDFRKAFGLKPDVVSVSLDYLPETASNNAKAHNLCVKLAHADFDDAEGISRNKATELLQYAVNAIIFKDNGKGLNAYRVMKSDTTWFVCAMANYRNHSTAFIKPDTMYALIFDLLGHIVCKRDYAVAK